MPSALELRIPRRAWEGNDVANVGHAGDEQQQALEAQSEAGVGAGAVAARVEVPPHVLHRDAQLPDARHELVVALLAHAAADDFAYLREEHVGALHGLAIGILLHVEGLDFLGVVGHDDGAAEVALHQVALVLAGQVAAPVDGEFELLAPGHGLLQYADALGVGQADELRPHHAAQAVEQPLIDHLVEEGEVVHAVVQRPLHAVLYELLLQVHQLGEVGEGHLGLHHPELGQVAGRVRVFSAERGAEGVDGSQGGGCQLAFELPGHGEARRLAEEVAVVHYRAVLVLLQVVEVHGGHLEHLPRPLAVGRGDDGRVEVVEAPVVEELVYGDGHVVAYAEHCPEGVGARTQVGNLAQELHGVAFLLQGVGVVARAQHFNLAGLHLHLLSGAHAGHQLSVHAEACSGGDVLQQGLVEAVEVYHHLHVVYGAAVVQCHEGHLLASPAGAHPSFHVDHRAEVFTAQQVGYLCSVNLFHFVNEELRMKNYSKAPMRR